MPITSHMEASVDPMEVRFRLDSVQAGVWVSFMVCAAAIAYTSFYAEESDRLPLALVIAAGLVGTVGMMQLPWEGIIRSRWREPVFMAWSLGDMVLIWAIAAIDGGADSPMALTFFVPIVFSGLSYPLRSVTIVGVLSVAAYILLAALTDTPPGHTLLFVASLLSVALMSVWQARNHERRREQVTRMSRTDPLTDVLNRRGLEDAAGGVLAGVDRYDWAATLVLLDLDDFKAYNDAHGHAAGDELLQRFVDAIRPLLRPSDALARIGGDEFAILLPQATRAEGARIAARIAESIGSEVPHSIGLACAPADGTALDQLYHHADEELYAAKRGRRRPSEVTATG